MNDTPKKPITQIPGFQNWVALKPWQQKGIVQLLSTKNKSLLMSQATGSGKTVTSIAAALVLRAMGESQRTLVVVPDNLQNNYVATLQKFTKGVTFQNYNPKNTEIDPDKDFTVVGYSYFRRHYSTLKTAYPPDTIIVDEVHHIRNPKSGLFKALWALRPEAKHFIGLTGSILNNTPDEILPLLEMTTGKPVLSKEDFDKKYITYTKKVRNSFGGSKKYPSVKDAQRIADVLSKHTSYLTLNDLGKNLPKKNLEIVKVPMASDQWRAYKYLVNKLSLSDKLALLGKKPIDNVKLGSLFSRLSAARKITNTRASLFPPDKQLQADEQTPKIQKILGDTLDTLVKNPNAHIVIYSNLINGGIKDIALVAKKMGIKFGAFTGNNTIINDVKVTKESKQKAVDMFNKGKLPVLLLSPAGTEGLSLPTATHLFMFDGHFNPQQIMQAEARIRRLNSIPKEVTIKRYVSTPPSWLASKMFPYPTIDQWTYNVAETKYKNIEPILSALHTLESKPSTPLHTFLKRKGIQLSKKPGTLYTARYKQPSGKITYEYDDKNKLGVGKVVQQHILSNTKNIGKLLPA